MVIAVYLVSLLQSFPAASYLVYSIQIIFLKHNFHFLPF